MRGLVGAAVVLAGLAGAPVALYAATGLHGFNELIRHGVVFWLDVTPTDPRLSPSMRLALAGEPPAAMAGPFVWSQVAPGLEVAELPVLAAGRQVDLVYLTRVDPGRFRFEVHTDPAGGTDLRAWMRTLHATVVINGSYYDRRGRPATPVVADGVTQGPEIGGTTEGAAFVASAHGATLRVLSDGDWRVAFRGAADGLVSFPLLAGPGLAQRPVQASRWLANRSFLGQDRAGRILLGTTADAFFSLQRLSAFLQAAPLDLSVAVNLDGGAVACQAVVAGSYRRDVCGQGELQDHAGRLQYLRLRQGRPFLPVALAVVPK